MNMSPIKLDDTAGRRSHGWIRDDTRTSVKYTLYSTDVSLIYRHGGNDLIQIYTGEDLSREKVQWIEEQNYKCSIYVHNNIKDTLAIVFRFETAEQASLFKLWWS
jgi:hypothetical protein